MTHIRVLIRCTIVTAALAGAVLLPTASAHADSAAGTEGTQATLGSTTDRPGASGFIW